MIKHFLIFCLLLAIQANHFGCNKASELKKPSPGQVSHFKAISPEENWINKEYTGEPDALDTSISVYSSSNSDLFRIHIMHLKNEYSCSDCDRFIFVSRPLSENIWLITDVKRVKLNKKQTLRPNCYFKQDSLSRVSPALVEETDSEENLNIDSAWLPDIQNGKLQPISGKQVSCELVDEESYLNTEE